MRRTQQEFKAEIIRRSSAYKEKRRRNLKNLLTYAGCTALILLGLQMVPLGMGGSSGTSAEMLMDNVSQQKSEAPMEMPEAPAAAEPECGQDLSTGYGENATVRITVSPLSGTNGTVWITDAQRIGEIEAVIQDFRIIGTATVEVTDAFPESDYEIVLWSESGEVAYRLQEDMLFFEQEGLWYISSLCADALRSLIEQ